MNTKGIIISNSVFFCFPLLRDYKDSYQSDGEDNNSVLNTEILNNAAKIYVSPYENRLKIYSDLKDKSFIYAKSYSNADTQKLNILQENKGKSGIQPKAGLGK